MLLKGEVGFTLVEMIVSIAISFLAVKAIHQMLINHLNVFHQLNNVEMLGHEISSVLSVIGQDVRLAGFTGCKQIPNVQFGDHKISFHRVILPLDHLSAPYRSGRQLIVTDKNHFQEGENIVVDDCVNHSIALVKHVHYRSGYQIVEIDRDLMHHYNQNTIVARYKHHQYIHYPGQHIIVYVPDDLSHHVIAHHIEQFAPQFDRDKNGVEIKYQFRLQSLEQYVYQYIPRL